MAVFVNARHPGWNYFLDCTNNIGVDAKREFSI